MRILTVISGVTLAAAGVGCLAIYRSSFMGIAFVFGMAMLISAICLISAYMLSGKPKLPETVLVEGMVTAIYGFAVLNNEISDTTMALFFGAWMACCGAIRFSQSVSVSRFDRYNWPKILPLAIVSVLVGIVMLMQSLISTANHMTLVGSAFILVGFSQLIYAMYMRPADPTPQVEQAKRRVEAKQRAVAQKRALRDELRSMNKYEREKKKLEIAIAKKADVQARKAQAKARKKAEREARRSALEPTMPFSGEEIAAMQEAMRSEEISYQSVSQSQKEYLPEEEYPPEDFEFPTGGKDPVISGEKNAGESLVSIVTGNSKPVEKQEETSAANTFAGRRIQFYIPPGKKTSGKKSETKPEETDSESSGKMFEGSGIDFGGLENRKAETDTSQLPRWGEVLKDSDWDSSSKRRHITDEPMFKKEPKKEEQDAERSAETEQEAAIKSILEEETPIPNVLPDYTPVFNPEFVLSPEAEKIDEELFKKPIEKEEPFTPFTAVTVADLNLDSEIKKPEQKEIDFTQEFSWTWHADD